PQVLCEMTPSFPGRNRTTVLKASCEVTALLPAASDKRDLAGAVRPWTGPTGRATAKAVGEHGAGRRAVTSRGANHRRLSLRADMDHRRLIPRATRTTDGSLARGANHQRQLTAPLPPRQTFAAA